MPVQVHGWVTGHPHTPLCAHRAKPSLLLSPSTLFVPPQPPPPFLYVIYICFSKKPGAGVFLSVSPRAGPLILGVRQAPVRALLTCSWCLYTILFSGKGYCLPFVFHFFPLRAERVFQGFKTFLKPERASWLLLLLPLMGCFSFFLSQASKLGDQVAELHLHNQKLRDKLREQESTVGACRSLPCALEPGAHPRAGT